MQPQEGERILTKAFCLFSMLDSIYSSIKISIQLVNISKKMDTKPEQNINEIHQKFFEYGRNAKEWQRKCILLLPEIAKREVWKAKGFSCIYEYAGKLAGMSRGQVDDALYILRKIEDKPALIKVVETKGVNAVRPVIGIATSEDEKFWAGKAKEMSWHTLSTYVRDFRHEQQVRSAPENENKIKTVSMQLPAKLAERLEKLKGDKNWEEIIEEIVTKKEQEIEATKRKLEEQKPAPVRTNSRHIPTKISVYVWNRSREQCEFPNCHKKAEHLHHSNRFCSDKIHDPDQIVALCEAHHDLAHRGLIQGEEAHAKNWKIRKEPDYTNLNWFVDRQVQLHRRS